MHYLPQARGFSGKSVGLFCVVIIASEILICGHIDFLARTSSLERLRSTVVLRRRAEAITWVRLQIARYGLSYADLAAADVFPSRQRQQKRLKVRYRSADGQTWDGEGEMPDWLQRAVNAGQSAEHFRVDT